MAPPSSDRQLFNTCPWHLEEELIARDAVSDDFFCDVCGNVIHKGGKAWTCPQCHWDKCSYCYKEHRLNIKEGDYVEATNNFQVGDYYILSRTIGKTVKAHDDGFEIDFYHNCCRHRVVHVKDSQTHKLIHIPEPKGMKRLIFGLLVIGLFFALGIIFHKQVSLQLTRFIKWCRAIGLWSSLLIMGVCVILPVIMMPVFPMMALSGPLFTAIYHGNPWVGGSISFLSVFTGLWLGSVIAFALGKSIFKEYASEAGKENKYLQRLNKIIDGGGTKIVFMARSLPILPAEVFDYACAVTSLTTCQYAIGCFGSAVPVAFWCFSTAQATGSGDKGHDEHGGGVNKLLLIALNVIALVVLTLVMVYTIKTQEGDLQVPDSAWDTVGTITESNPVYNNLRQNSTQLLRSLTSPLATDDVSPKALE